MKKTGRETDEMLKMIMENTNSLVAVLNKDGAYEYVSPSHQKLLGYTSVDLLGKSGLDHILPEDADKMVKILEKALSGEVDKVFGLTFRLLAKGGTVHSLQGNFDSIRDGQGKVKQLVYVVNDISDRIESETALNREKEKFRILVEKIPLGILLLNQNGQIEYINPKFADIVGYTQKDIATGEDWLKTAYPNIEYRQQIVESWKEDQAQARRGGAPPRKYTVTCKDGSEKTVLFNYIILDTGAQLVVCQDVTRQDAIEAQFMHSQKMESIGRLASGVAHDFNNLLTTIIGNADFALMDLEGDDPRHETILEIKDAADRATGLTRQLLAFSRKQRSHPEVLNLNEKITEIKKMLERLIGENIELALFLNPDAGLVKIDPGQIEQIIMNLAVNAHDAMPEGGRLTIETASVELSEDDPVSPVELRPGAYVLLSINDTGTGISPEIQSQIFEPFFTTKEKGKGTGLGLSTVYGIVKQNNGNIMIYSELGKGTTINIFLPAYAGSVSGKKEKTVKDAGLYGAETILMVEDEQRVREIVKRMLSRYGYNVVAAGDGREAQHIFRTYHLPIKLLLTDMIMPGINGLELAKVLLGLQPDLKVLCMSGYTDSALHKKVIKEGIAFIHKPFTSTALAQAIRKLLDG